MDQDGGLGTGKRTDYAAALGVVIFGVDVEVGDFADGGPGWVGGYGCYVVDAQSGTIVGLVGKSVDDVFCTFASVCHSNVEHFGKEGRKRTVMIDALISRLIESSLLRVLERRNVPDVRDGIPISRRSSKVFLVNFVVEE